MSDYIYIGAGLLIFLIIIICALVFQENDEENGIDEMDGGEFEEFAAEILHRSGIEVLELTKASGAFGADIIVIYEGERMAVQCKRYSRPIGVKAVQEAISAKDYYKCPKAAVITNSTFTRQARELAAESGVILWDREAVAGFMAAAENKNARPEIKRKTTVKIHRLLSGEQSEEMLLININGEEYELPPRKTTIITVSGESLKIILKYRRKKAAVMLDLERGLYSFTAGIYKNKPFLEEIS